MWAPWTPETGEGVTEVTWKVNIQVKRPVVWWASALGSEPRISGPRDAPTRSESYTSSLSPLHSLARIASGFLHLRYSKIVALSSNRMPSDRLAR